jgi:hypothetical protein
LKSSPTFHVWITHMWVSCGWILIQGLCLASSLAVFRPFLMAVLGPFSEEEATLEEK